MTTQMLSEQLQAQIAEKEQVIAEHQSKWVDAQNSGNWIMSEQHMATIESMERTKGELYCRLAHALLEDNRLLRAERDRYRAERDGLWRRASDAVRSAEQQHNLYFNGAQEDR